MFDFKVSIVEEYTPFFISGALLTVKLSVIAISWRWPGFHLRNICLFRRCALSRASGERRFFCRY